MSCPNWTHLADVVESERDASPEWGAAMEHFDRCESCRQDAIAVDPALVFRRLPGWSVDAEEIASMKDSVAALRKAESTRERMSPAPTSRFAWRRAAAAALLAGVGLFALPTAQHSAPEATSEPQALALDAVADDAVAPGISDYPYIEGARPPGGAGLPPGRG